MPRRRSRRGGTVALSAATAGPRCAPIIMDYVRRRPRAGNSAVRSRRTGAAARPQGPKGRNTVNSYYHISIKSVHTSYSLHGETMENGSVVRFVPTVNGSDRRVSGGPEGAQSPKWAKPPHISSRGGRSQKSSAGRPPAQGPAPQMPERVRGSRSTAYVTMSDAVLDPYGVLYLFLVSPKWIGCRFALWFRFLLLAVNASKSSPTTWWFSMKRHGIGYSNCRCRRPHLSSQHHGHGGSTLRWRVWPKMDKVGPAAWKS